MIAKISVCNKTGGQSPPPPVVKASHRVEAAFELPMFVFEYVTNAIGSRHRSPGVVKIRVVVAATLDPLALPLTNHKVNRGRFHVEDHAGIDLEDVAQIVEVCAPAPAVPSLLRGSRERTEIKKKSTQIRHETRR